MTPRSVLGLFSGRGAGKIIPALGKDQEGFCTFTDEDASKAYYGAGDYAAGGAPIPTQPPTKPKPKADHQQQKRSQEDAVVDGVGFEDVWLIEKIKKAALKGMMQRVTDPETYDKPTDKQIERIIAGAKHAKSAQPITKYFGRVLAKCSAGSLTDADDAIRILKTCHMLHAVMKKGTAETYKHVFEDHPDIFDIPQIAMPKAIPSSCVEARMAVAYASFLNARVRLRQQETITQASIRNLDLLSHTPTLDFCTMGILGEAKALSVNSLFDFGLACRFYRKSDSNKFVTRDVIHMFQLHIISDLLAHAEEYERVNAHDEEGRARVQRRKGHVCSWAERMQARRFLPWSDYTILKRWSKSVKESKGTHAPAPAPQESLI